MIRKRSRPVLKPSEGGDPFAQVNLKKNGKKRPLGMPTWSDKLLAEVMRMILDAYLEPQFSPHSHGFRPERGCHTALREIYHNWVGTVWFIEARRVGAYGIPV